MLSGTQFQGLSRQLRTSGGFTVDTNTGDQPTSGIVVSQEGTRERLVNAQASHLAHFAKRNETALGQPDTYMGGWDSGPALSRHSHVDVLDVSKVIPDHPRGHHVAEAHARMHNERQEAAYDITSGKTINNPKWPYPDGTDSGSWSEPDEHGSSTRLVKRRH